MERPETAPAGPRPPQSTSCRLARNLNAAWRPRPLEPGLESSPEVLCTVHLSGRDLAWPNSFQNSPQFVTLACSWTTTALKVVSD